MVTTKSLRALVTPYMAEQAKIMVQPYIPDGQAFKPLVLCMNTAWQGHVQQPPSPEKKVLKLRATYPPLESLTCSTVPTEQCGFYINRAAQTLRHWAAYEDGALVPIRINGRLHWKVAEIKRLLGEAQPASPP